MAGDEIKAAQRKLADRPRRADLVNMPVRAALEPDLRRLREGSP